MWGLQDINKHIFLPSPHGTANVPHTHTHTHTPHRAPHRNQPLCLSFPFRKSGIMVEVQNLESDGGGDFMALEWDSQGDVRPSK